MKTIQKIIYSNIFIISMLLITINLYPCSTVLLKNKKSLLVCRNLDTPVALPGYLCVNKRGETRIPLRLPIQNCHESSWIVKYGSVTFTAMGRGFSDGGMNEKGLVIEEMSLPDTEYVIDSNHTYLTSPQWIQYQLDNFSTVEEVINNLDSILPIGWVWHFFVADKTGNSASTEFIKGKLIVHEEKDMPYQCLSNSLYSESVEFYKSLDSQNIPDELTRQSDQDNSLDRFAIAIQKSNDFKNIKPQQSVDYAFDLLRTIAGTKGYAKRSIVYDVRNQAVYFCTDSNSAVRKLFFKDLDFHSNNHYLDLTLGHKENIANQLAESTLESKLDLHNSLENLLSTFFKPKDEFPNMGIDIRTYWDETYNYYISNTLNSNLQQKYNELDSYLKRFYNINDLPGFAVGVIKDHQIVFAKGYGYQDVKNGKQMTHKSVFHMASVSKPFAATAIMQLHESGKLNIDTPLVIYLPYFKLDDDRYKDLTLRQLLNHTSGLADYHDDSQFEWDNPQFDDGTAERFVRGLENKKLYQPGVNFAYSSIAFDILPDLISKVTGMTFEEYMKTHILDPLGMQHSTFMKNEVPVELATLPYELNTDAYKYEVSKYYPYNRMCAGSGTLHSNVFDMFKWCSCNLNKGTYNGHQLFAEETFDELTEPNDNFSKIGIGWILEDYEGMKRVYHSGSDIGYSLHHMMIPDKSIAVIALGNTQVFPSKDIALAALNIYSGKNPEQIKEPVSIPFREKLAKEGLDSAIAEYKYLKMYHKNDYDFNPYNLGIIAIRQMQQEKIDLSIDLFNFLLEEYPDVGSILYYYLGLAHLKQGRNTLAKSHFNRVIELDSGDIRAMEILHEIDTYE